MGKSNEMFEALKSFAAQTPDDPFDSVAESESKKATQRLQKRRLVEEADDDKKALDRLEARLKKFGHIDDDDFDILMDTIDEYDEDSDLREQIIRSGRKYAKDFAASEQSSELTKAFAPQENMIRSMIKEVDKEIMEVNNDLEQQRFARTRSGKSLADMVTSKKELFNTKLNMIKELNKIKVDQFNIRSKQDNNMGSGEDPMITSNAMLQNIFGMGDSFFSEGGREYASGAIDYDDDYEGDDDYEEVTETDHANATQAIAHSAVNDMELSDSDGDLFLKHENDGVQYVLEEDMDGNQRVYAEDKEHNVIDDYPLPDNIDDLSFEKNMNAGTAVDQFQRQYVYKYTGSDVQTSQNPDSVSTTSRILNGPY